MGKVDEGFIDADQAREQILEYIRSVAGPRDDGRPELIFAIREFGVLIPWDFLREERKQRAKRAMSALHDIRDKMRQIEVLIYRYWPEGNGDSNGRKVARAGCETRER